jgi:tetratricopeptide (TPR) repeat protein
MRIMPALLGILLPACLLFGQLRTKIDIDAETPEGLLLQQIGQEQDAGKKLSLLEEFATKYPQHPGLPWVLGQVEPMYAKAGQHDKVTATAEKILAADPADAEMAHVALKSAEAKGDPDLVLAWATKTRAAAEKAASIPKPDDEDEAESWKQRIDFAAQVQKYCEFAVYAQSVKTTDPAKKIQLMDALKEMNPKSEYVPQLREHYFVAYRQAGDNAKAAAIAEQLAAENKATPDMLLIAANQAMTAKNADKTLEYAAKLVAKLESEAAPPGISPEDWTKHKNMLLGLGHYLRGVTLSGQNKFAAADKELREALPLLDNELVKAETLFHLGLVNYKMAAGAKDATKYVLDALNFNKQCAAIKSPYQAQAQRNIAAIRSQYRLK